MTTEMSRRRLLAGTSLAFGSLAAVAAPAVARAETRRWRMVTSWPKKLPGPGMSAERVAERIRVLSGGAIDITVHAAGEVVPALEVLDAVGAGVVEMGHSASIFWQGKQPAAPYFCTVPFGLTPPEHTAWIEAGGGQALWDALYAPFGVKPFMAGNTGVSMGGWFRKELDAPDALRGMKIRVVGLGGEIYRRLGATPVTMAPGEIITGLQSGLVDGAEFVGPGSDIALGLYRVASFYYAPGFNKPNGTGECLIARKVWETLDSQSQAIIAHACAAEAAFALNEMERLNIEAVQLLTTRHKVRLLQFPATIVDAARPVARAVVAELGQRDAIGRDISQSYWDFAGRSQRWSALSLQAIYGARG